MLVRDLALLVLVAGGCKQEPPGIGREGCDKELAAAAGCDLGGDYRLVLSAGGHDVALGVHVTGAPPFRARQGQPCTAAAAAKSAWVRKIGGTLLPPISEGQDELVVGGDPARCSLRITMYSAEPQVATDLALALDPATGAVTGTGTFTGPLVHEDVAVAGKRTVELR